MDLISELKKNQTQEQRQLLSVARNLIQSGGNRFAEFLSHHNDDLVSLNAIRRICLNYRLRFLDISFFKGEIPEKAFQKVREIEKTYGLSLKKLHIIAPGELFKLENREKDPLLLAEIFEDTFIIIHKWGNDLHPFRFIQSMPLRTIPTMVLTFGLAAFLFSLCMLPFTGGFETSLKTFVLGFVVMWAGVMSYGAFISFSQNIFPTSVIWKSKFLD